MSISFRSNPAHQPDFPPFLAVENPKPHYLALVNRLFPLTVGGITIWHEGEQIPFTCRMNTDAQGFYDLELGERLLLELHVPLVSLAKIKVECYTPQIGNVIFQAAPIPFATPTSHRKRKLYELFKREYEIDLMVDANEIIARQENQLSGFALVWGGTEPNEQEIAHWNNMVKKSKPETLFFSYTPNLSYNAFLSLCRKQEIHPIVAFELGKESADEIDHAIAKLTEAIPQKEWWTPIFTIALSITRYFLAGESGAQEAAAQWDQTTRQIHAKMPNAQFLLLSVPPETERETKWNQSLFRALTQKPDAFGWIWASPGMKGWINETPETALDTASSLPSLLERQLQRAEKVLQSALPDDTIPLAVIAPGFFRAPTRPNDVYQTTYSKQDAFFYEALHTLLRQKADRVRYAVIGSLGGPLGLIQADGVISAAAPVWEIIQDCPNMILKTHTIKEKALPAYEWSGIPGLLPAESLPYVELFAARSADASELFLVVVNRDLKRRLIAHVYFRNMENMRPKTAKVIRSKRNVNQNSITTPENVVCGVIKLGKIKKMDHVNLDIPAGSIASMTLKID